MSDGASGLIRPLKGWIDTATVVLRQKKCRILGPVQSRPKQRQMMPRPLLDPTSLSFLIIEDNRFARTQIKNALYAFGPRRMLEAANAKEGIDVLCK